MICDYHTQSMIDLAGVLSEDMPYNALRAQIMDRLARFEAGTIAVPRSFLHQLKTIDENLSARWDMFRQCWVIERYAPRVRAYMEVFTAERLDNRIFDVLHSSDSHRYRSVGAFMTARRESAAKKRAEIEHRNTERLLGIVDDMSPTQIKDFCETNEYLANKEVACI